MKKIKIHWPSALLSILLAFTVWFTVAGRERVEAWVNVQLVIKDVPPGYIIMNGNTLPSAVEVRLRGPGGLIRNLSGQHIPMLLSMSNLKEGNNQIHLTGDDIPISGAFDIMEIRPSTIEVKVDLEIEKEVPLTAKPANTLPKGIISLKLIPPQETITLKGPKTILERINKVEALVNLPPEINQKELSAPAYISLPQNVEAIPNSMTIKVLAEGENKTITIQRPVGFAEIDAMPSNLSITPPTVAITVQIPFNWDEKNKQLQQVFALLNPPKGEMPKQTTELKISVQTPEKVKFISVEPQTVTVKIDN